MALFLESMRAFALRPAEVCDSRSKPYRSLYVTWGEPAHAASAPSPGPMSVCVL